MGKQGNNVVGQRGEDEAVNYLNAKGYSLVERNFRTKYGEIDVIMLDGLTLVFIEVKAKCGDKYGHPWEMVDRKKIAQVRKMGEVYLHNKESELEKRKWKGLCRVDVVSVTLSPELETLQTEHFENIY